MPHGYADQQTDGHLRDGDRGGITLADVPGYLDRVGLYRDTNAKFLKLAPEDYAAMIVGELERVGAVRKEGGRLLPRQ